MDGWLDESIVEWIYVSMDGLFDAWLDRKMDRFFGLMDRWTFGWNNGRRII